MVSIRTTRAWRVRFTHPCNDEPNNERIAFNETTAQFECRETDVTVADAEICDGFSTEICVEVLEGSWPYSFSWSGPLDYSSTDSCITVAVEGDYTVTVTDAHGCTDTATGHLTVHPNPIVEVNDGETCAGSFDELCAQVESGEGPFFFSWSGPEGFSSSDSCITVGVAGEYTVTVTDQNGCTGTGGGVLTVNPNPIPTVASAEACSGFEAGLCVVVEGNGPFTFSWGGPAAFSSSDSCIVVAVEGDYTVTVTDINGCTGTTSGHVTIHPNPVVNVADGEACDGFSDELCAVVEGGQGPYAYSWSGPGQFVSTQECIDVAVDGDYTVTVTDSHGCTGTTTAHLTIHPNPIVEVNAGETCDGFSDELCALVESGTGPFSYSWTGPSGFTSSLECIEVGVAGEYLVTVTDANGCTGTGSGVLTVNPNPIPTVASAEACDGFETGLCVVVDGNGPYTFSWSGPAAFSSSDSCIVVAVEGDYTVTVTDRNGCTGTTSGHVTIHPNPVVNVADGEACDGFSDELCAVVEGGQGPYSYSWSGPGQFTARGTDSLRMKGISTQECIDVAVDGDYTVTVTDAHGCTGNHDRPPHHPSQSDCGS